MIDKYILDGHVPIKCDDVITWVRQRSNRIVAQDKLPGDVLISTVFLGSDHQFDRRGPPLLFETMIFGGPHDEYQDRCSTWEQAEAMHAKAIEIAKKTMAKCAHCGKDETEHFKIASENNFGRIVTMPDGRRMLVDASILICPNAVFSPTQVIEEIVFESKTEPTISEFIGRGLFAKKEDAK